ncbi:aryl-hydrocarbon-interacting protein-like 1 [Megalops cyprinoides]|uniref:aryl-hydrocarbon-interacting protein-like 1 n=1 Tax=Megalops cyprinoides TaxID=118141 RepID=UPI001864C8BC|nr:aryl-hydrocarbon-interacting protein-like 1 [Megalops cyprinoides]
MEETYLLKHPGVKKKILHGGQGPMPHFPPGTKLAFHFQTLKDDFERTVIDDSRKGKQPVEIFVGKMFKMEVWEVLLTSMRIGEVAEFWCDAIHTGLYPIVSKGMRLAAQGRDPLEGQKHMCGMGNLFHYHSTGFPELDELMRDPQPLIFIMELISVGDPFSYKRESWMMDKDEKLKAVPSLHMQGNALVKQRRFQEAAEKYHEAVLLLKIVQSREMPGHEDYINLDRLITPLVLNYCQCMLELEQYYKVLEQTTELLEKHKDNVKAYYKRAKAHAAVWNEKEARKDFLMVANLDITLAPLVHRELKQLSERMKEKYWEEKSSYWGILEEKEGENLRKEEDEEEEETVTQGEEAEKTQDPEEQAQDEQREVTAKDEAANEAASSQATNQSARPVMEGKDWQQMLRLAHLLHDEGNFLIKEKHYLEATEKYKEAIEYIDYLQTKHVDREGEDWESLEKVRLPLTLNLSQCLLELEEHNQVLEINTKLLKTHKDNLKAVYQRGRAHSALYHEDEARKDFGRVVKLDPKFKPIVRLELRKMGENIRAKHAREKKNYWMTAEEKRKKGVKVRRSEKNQGEKEAGVSKKGAAATDNISKEGLEDRASSAEESERLQAPEEEQAERDNPATDKDDKEGTDFTQSASVKDKSISAERPGAETEAEVQNVTSVEPAQGSTGATDRATNANAGNDTVTADPANESQPGAHQDQGFEN